MFPLWIGELGQEPGFGFSSCIIRKEVFWESWQHVGRCPGFVMHTVDKKRKEKKRKGNDRLSSRMRSGGW